MPKKSFPLSKVYGLLEPGLVVMVSTARKGWYNIMTMSWLYDDGISTSFGGGCDQYSFNRAGGKGGGGNTSGRKVDKFDAFGLTPKPASLVKAPFIDKCFANLECRVADGKMINTYNFFILSVVKAWIDPLKKKLHTIHHQGKGIFMMADETVKLSSMKK